MQLVKQPWPDLDLPAALDPSLWPALRSLLGPDAPAPAALRRPALPAKLLTSPQSSGLAGGGGHAEGTVLPDSALGGAWGCFQGVCVQQAQCFPLIV